MLLATGFFESFDGALLGEQPSSQFCLSLSFRRLR